MKCQLICSIKYHKTPAFCE